MKIFLGTHVRKIDRNGRVSIPSKFRVLLESQGSSDVHVFPSRHDDDVLVGCGDDHLLKLQERLSPQDPTSEAYDAITYSIFGDVETFSIDGDGRIVLPPALREIMGVDKEIAFVGRGEQFSLMRPDRVGGKVAKSRDISREKHEGLLALPGGGPRE
ncbi:division/cell wall cluster transcriptional repressor MraZ [Minwuia sp.]|uniref:division/cell wall cluster transcriptional repressor MraZ n=1 Tax=Minwuia sp. TaxID=2493630 RepID=UPI003A94E2E1